MIVSGCTAPEKRQWSQWGGPNRNFMVETEGLADSWPESGPEKLWYRELGDGYSTVIVDGSSLYTMYRKGDEEFTVSLDAKTGETLWEFKNPSPFTDTQKQFGPGPHSSPLVVGDYVYSAGTNMMFTCLEKETGKLVWQHDLVKEYEVPVPRFGYGCSPIAYENLVIIPVGRERESHRAARGEEIKDETDLRKNQSLVAFDQKTGKEVWKSQDYSVGYSSPMLVEYDGEDQLVFLMSGAIGAVNPETGESTWKYEMKGVGGISMPLWLGNGEVFYSSGEDSRMIRLSKADGTITPEEVWTSRKLRIPHANAVKVDDLIVGSSGDDPSFLVALKADSGKRVWIERGFSKSTCLYGDDKLIILDENGQLGLARVTEKGLDWLSRCTVGEKYSWAAPTLVGKTLYVRDRKHIMALDLG